jgi:dethiobiotin synthetase
MARTIFVTGTDTGVGKTVFAASLVYVLRSQKVNALGMKPFCSGSRDDITVLQSVQPGALSAEEVNPFYFHDPVAPLAVLREARRNIALKEVLAKIRHAQKKADVLVIEGSGGLMVPLGEGYTVADLIRALKCEVVVVSRNKLGTINHTLLTVNALKRLKPKKVSVVLMERGTGDASTAANFGILRELVSPVPILSYPFLGHKRMRLRAFRGSARILKKVLATYFN